MEEWLNTATHVDATISSLAMRLCLAWLAGVAVALIARRGKPADRRNELTLTLVLMSVLIAMATQIIGDNIARAFSLVGALSIVRFRTAVPATRDVAFVLASVVVGMAIGAGQYWVCGLGLIVVAMATFLGSAPAASKADASDQPRSEQNTATNDAQNWRLTLQVGLHTVSGWEEILGKYCSQYTLQSAQTTRRGGALELVYDCVAAEHARTVDLVASLNGLPNVEAVSIKSR